MLRVIALAVVTMVSVATQAALPPAVFGGRSLLNAHNAYPEDGQWRDRLDRAVATGQFPIVIEQDVAFAPGRRPGEQSVLSHDVVLDGGEPSLHEHFFTRVRPIMEPALRAGLRERWPLFVLHLDFKTNETAHHRAVWDLLRQHEEWLTTAPAAADASQVSAFKPGPLLVLTENGADQETDFSSWAAAHGSHLLFGSIPGPEVARSDDPAERARLMLNASPAALVPAAATSYRRWVNFPWMAVEAGGPTNAGPWTRDDERRLEQIVDYTHGQGLLIRFYTLNGHTAARNQGWTASYNFGSLDAVRMRWRAAIRSGVDLIATDQYEELAAVLRATRR